MENSYIIKNYRDVHGKDKWVITSECSAAERKGFSCFVIEI